MHESFIHYISSHILTEIALNGKGGVETMEIGRKKKKDVLLVESVQLIESYLRLIGSVGGWVFCVRSLNLFM